MSEPTMWIRGAGIKTTAHQTHRHCPSRWIATCCSFLQLQHAPVTKQVHWNLRISNGRERETERERPELLRLHALAKLTLVSGRRSRRLRRRHQGLLLRHVFCLESWSFICAVTSSAALQCSAASTMSMLFLLHGPPYSCGYFFRT